MVLLAYFLHESDPRRDHQQIVLYSFLSLHALALLAVKILLQIFLYEDLRRWPYIHLSVISTPEYTAGPHFVTQPILLNGILIFDINHQQNTKEVRPDWNDKNDNANYALVSHGRFYQWLRLPFLKKYSIKCEKFRLLWIVFILN